MGADEGNSNFPQMKLTGWKMIGRHLGRSQRAVQFWEEQRGLPIHRIPGGRGQTVFAYAAELDAWMHSRSASMIGLVASTTVTVLETPVRAMPPTHPARTPGVLVLPCEVRSETGCGSIGDALCQQLIVRLSAVQPLRVLSWTTSRCERQSVDSIESMARRLQVRYIVEATIERGDEALHVDVRIIDAEIDRILLADRFVVADGASPTAHAEVAEGVALHFALLHAGALVEPMCLADMPPALFLDYLAAARWFFEDDDGSTGRALALLDRVVLADPHFDLARALRGLVLLQSVPPDRAGAVVDEARGIVDALMHRTDARVTVAFLATAIDRIARVGGASSTAAKAALRWMPSSVVREGRLYDRRSTLQAPDDAVGGRRGVEDRNDPFTARQHGFLDDLLHELMLAHRGHDRSMDAQTRVIHVRFPRAASALGDHLPSRAAGQAGGDD